MPWGYCWLSAVVGAGKAGWAAGVEEGEESLGLVLRGPRIESKPPPCKACAPALWAFPLALSKVL